MSFAKETKASLISLSENLKHDCCRRAELYGILCTAGIFTRQRIKLVTSCEGLAALTMKRLHDLYQIDGNLYVTEHKSGEADERSSNKITVVQKKDMERLFGGFHYPADAAACGIRPEMFRCTNCRAAFVRGAFLSCGTITDPDKGYHLELTLTDETLAEGLALILTGLELEPKRMVRKSEQVLYYKDSQSIETFLATVGANNAMFTLMNKKIERELRSQINRMANGELANLGKTVSAATDQLSAIRALIDSGEIDRMPDELKQTAMLRLENESATLSQLAALHDPPITKSGVNHRLKKIIDWKS